MEYLEAALNWIGANGLDIVNALLMIVGGASVIVRLTPTPKDDHFLARIREKLEKLALNPTINRKD